MMKSGRESEANFIREAEAMTFHIPHKVTAKDGFNRFWAGTHWTQRKRWCDQWHARVRGALPKYARQYDKPVIIEFWFDSRLDADGHSAIVKTSVDTLVEEGILINDNQKYVKGVCMWVYGENVKKDHITVRVSEVEE